MICPNCGKEYNEKMTCCISCGSRLVPFEKDLEQTAFEPLIPEAVTIPEKNGIEALPEEGVLRRYNNEETVSEPITVKKRGRRFSASIAARTAGSLAASAVMFALIMLSAASLTARLMTDSEKIAEFASRLDVMSLPAVIAPKDQSISSDTTVQEAVFTLSEGTGLTREDIREIYENSTAGEFLADQLDGYARLIREGEMPEKLTTEKLKAAFTENIDLISESIGTPLSGHDIDLAFSELDRAEPVLEAIAPARLESAVGEKALTALRLFRSLPVMVIESCIAVSMLLVLRLINKRTSKVLSWGGGAVLAGGMGILLTAFLCSAQVFFTGKERFIRSIIKCAADVICPDIYRLGAVLAVIGIIMLLWSATLKKSRSKA